MFKVLISSYGKTVSYDIELLDIVNPIEREHRSVSNLRYRKTIYVHISECQLIILTNGSI